MRKFIAINLCSAVAMIWLASAGSSQEREQLPLPGGDAGQADEAKKGKVGNLELKKDEPESEPVDPQQAAQKLKEIVERLHKNMDSSEERLGKKDPGEETRNIQKKIIDDLDELIKQQQDSNNNSSSSSSSSKSGSKSGSQSSSSANGGSPMGNPMGNQGNKGGQAQQNSKNGGGKEGDKKDNPMNAGAKKEEDKGGKQQAKGNGKEEKKDGKSAGKDQAKGEPGKEGKAGGGLGGKNTPPKERNTVADIFQKKDIWGHLPQNKRLEMDAYSRERFLPKYDELLRQYYRTIAEQGRRRDGE